MRKYHLNARPLKLPNSANRPPRLLAINMNTAHHALVIRPLANFLLAGQKPPVVTRVAAQVDAMCGGAREEIDVPLEVAGGVHDEEGGVGEEVEGVGEGAMGEPGGVEREGSRYWCWG